MMSDAVKGPGAGRRRDIAVAAACGVFVALMVGLAYAAVPLYSWFCRATGFGGIPQIANVAPAGMLDRKITVRFDANVGPGLPWRFAPEVTSIDLKIGEVATVYYRVTNESARATAGQAAYNVAPTTVGAYFTKINCFCFTEQRLAPGEKREMAVVFYVDPALAKDSEQDDLNTITLSYTFYPIRDPKPADSAETPQSLRGAQRSRLEPRSAIHDAPAGQARLAGATNPSLSVVSAAKAASRSLSSGSPEARPGGSQ